MNREPKTGLVLQGGGARGAYQAGALRAIVEVLADRSGNPFEVISGTSVGAINACLLAARSYEFKNAVKRLEALWWMLKTEHVFDPSLSSILGTLWRFVRHRHFDVSRPKRGWFDNDPLRKLLENEFDPSGIERSLNEGFLDGFSVTASCYDRGTAVTYFQSRTRTEPWIHSRREGFSARISVDHIMASAALPCIFPAVKVGGTWHGDGALRLTSPLSTVTQLGAERVVVIGVRDARVRHVSQSEDPYPSVGEITGHAFDILFNDNLDTDIERIERINEILLELPESEREKSEYNVIDILVLQPSEDLRDIAQRNAHEVPSHLGLILKSMGGSGGGRLASYLLFEHGFIRELIELGYQDTIKRRDEIERFFSSDTTNGKEKTDG